MRRVLELLRDLVPYEQCAMLEARLGYEPRVVLGARDVGRRRVLLTETLVDIFGRLVDTDARRARPAARPEGAPRRAAGGARRGDRHLAVRSSVAEYTEEHLRALSVVAAKLAAYFTIRAAR